MPGAVVRAGIDVDLSQVLKLKQISKLEAATPDCIATAYLEKLSSKLVLIRGDIVAHDLQVDGCSDYCIVVRHLT